MDRLTGKDARLMMEAVASVYMKEEVDQEVISEEVVQLDERSRPTGQQRAAIRTARRQAAADLKANEVAAGGGQAAIDNKLKDRYGGRMPSARQQARHSSRNLATRSVAATGRENLYRAGGGDAAMRDKGQTRDQVMAQGVKNFKAKQATPTPTPAQTPAPAAPANNAVASKAPAPKPAANPNVTAGGTKFERRLPTMAELRAAQAARKAAPKVLSRSEIENRAVTAGVNAGKPTVPTGGAVGSAAKPAAAAAKPATAVGSAAKPVAAAAKPATAVGSAAKPVAAAAKPTGSPAAQAAAGAPNRKEDLFTGKPIPSAKPTGGATAVGSAAAAAKPAPAGSAAAGSAGAAAAPVVKKKPAMGARNRMRMEEFDIFDTIKEHLISEHELSEDVAIQVMTLLDEETRGEIMEYTAQMRADAAPKGTTMKMTATGKEPAGDRLLRGIKDRVGGFLRNLNPNALKSTTVEPRKPLVSTQKNSYELEGELVDEGSCGSKKKRTSKKKGY